MSNDKIINEFELLISELKNKSSDKSLPKSDITKINFKIKHFKNAVNIIKVFPNKITKGDDLKDISGIGKGIISRIDEIIKNYSDRQHQLGQPENSLSQGIELVMDLPANLGVGQLNGIVERITAYIEENDQLDSPVVSFSEDGSSGELLTVFAKA